MTGDIKDWQLAASSVISRSLDEDCAVKHARLHGAGRTAWCPQHKKKNEWLLVDLGVNAEVNTIDH